MGWPPSLKPLPQQFSQFFTPLPDSGLLAGLVAALYGLWTLLPDSHSAMVTWPGVALWQGAVLLPMLWLLWQGWQRSPRHFALGGGWDVWVAFMLGVLGISALGAAFPAQALWYSIPALGGVAALYGVCAWGRSAPARWERLLQFQGGLATGFIVLSLGLWLSQVYGPALDTLARLRQAGGAIAFNVAFLSLRNWYPVGHPNYVAGFLVLNLPLLGALACRYRGRGRAGWAIAALLGLLDLYTTNSRAGWLGLFAAGLVAGLLGIAGRPSSRRWLGAGLGVSLLAVLSVLLTNARLRNSLLALAQGDVRAGDLVYRLITTVTGWHIGLAHPWLGAGLGSAPLLYQAYRPPWAGREAELIYQLHSTPVQLWAELGLGGGLIGLGGVALGLRTVVRWRRGRGGIPPAVAPLLVGGSWAGLVGYGLFSLTDYQLDNLCISGSGVVLLAVAIAAAYPPIGETPRTFPGAKHWALAGVGLIAALGLWLVPIHRAWNLSAQGFAAIAQDRVEDFTTALTAAHALAPWEPYYPYLLGWQLGELSLTETAAAPRLQTEARRWLQVAIWRSPHWEFGYSTLGWLAADPTAGSQDFAQAAQLIPAKVGLFWGMGIQLLQRGDLALAQEAMTLEMLRHPMFLTSPVFQLPPFSTFYDDLLNQVDAQWSDWLASPALSVDFQYHLHQVRGSLRWWRGDAPGAEADWIAAENPLGLALLDLSQNRPVELQRGAIATEPGAFAMQAWQDPAQRREKLIQGWIARLGDVENLADLLPEDAVIDQLAASMDGAETFDQWLRQGSPVSQNRNVRLGFGVLSRHGDGPMPVDYWAPVDNAPLVSYFETLLPSPRFLPELDQALQPLQQDVMARIPGDR